MGSCARTGQCCELILLDHSPKQIRESYIAWRDSTPNATTYQDMHLIYPMLAGRCKGKKELGGKIKYIYGPCKNFERDEKGLPVCTIHENKPKMCSGYPHYGSAQVITMNVEGKVNPAWHRGCGYNADPSYGGTNETLILGVQPLAKDEE